jgi:hypothetical protein
VADDRDGLALDLADASKQVAAERAVGGNLLGVALFAVGEQPVLDAVIMRARSPVINAAAISPRSPGRLARMQVLTSERR